MDKPKILVHICCGPDALYVAGLLQETHDVTGFFYNPNIQPRGEYDLRLAETVKVAARLGFHLVEGPYDGDTWTRLTAKFKDEPEKGRRCDVCYAMRLRKTAETARESGIGIFTTIMSLSPWKKADVMNRIGGLFAASRGVAFLAADFKKKDGFRKSVAMSRAAGLYRQDYCGCLASRRNRETKAAE
jgi:predicted adenine nucleotide alpha hydrolase (AANH) superfamily ATPase